MNSDWNRCQAIANVSEQRACGGYGELDVTEDPCLSKPRAAWSFHSQIKNGVRVILYLQSLLVSHNTNNSFPSLAGAHKGTARSRQDSPQYPMITRRKSSWQASSGSTAAEPSPLPWELQACSWKPRWSKTATDKTAPCTVRWPGRGGWQEETEREGQCYCLRSTGEKVLLTNSAWEHQVPHQLLSSAPGRGINSSVNQYLDARF